MGADVNGLAAGSGVVVGDEDWVGAGGGTVAERKGGSGFTGTCAEGAAGTQPVASNTNADPPIGAMEENFTA